VNESTASRGPTVNADGDSGFREDCFRIIGDSGRARSGRMTVSDSELFGIIHYGSQRHGVAAVHRLFAFAHGCHSPAQVGPTHSAYPVGDHDSPERGAAETQKTQHARWRRLGCPGRSELLMQDSFNIYRHPWVGGSQ